MIVRIVKLTFQEQHIAAFLEIFDKSKTRIRAFDGCKLVELYRDETHTAIFFTYSYWDEAADLEKYRNSEFFKSVWAKTKVLFSEKPEAWSVNKLESLI